MISLKGPSAEREGDQRASWRPVTRPQNGTPGQRKAVIETNIAEITVNGNKIIPVFRIPRKQQSRGTSGSQPNSEDGRVPA